MTHHTRRNILAYLVSLVIAVVLIAAAVILTGCVSASYDPETGKIHYTRLGDQKVSLSVSKDGDDISLELIQESEARALSDMAKAVTNMAEKFTPATP